MTRTQEIQQERKLHYFSEHVEDLLSNMETKARIKMGVKTREAVKALMIESYKRGRDAG